MSERLSFGLMFLEKILGTIIAVIGALLTYYTYNSPGVPAIASFFFMIVGVMLIVIGLLLLIAKTR